MFGEESGCVVHLGVRARKRCFLVVSAFHDAMVGVCHEDRSRVFGAEGGCLV